MNCYDSTKKILADTPLKQEYSQHTNIFGILTSAFPEEQAQKVMQIILEDSSLIQTTIYFKFYLFEALKKAGLGDLYLDQLGPWSDMLAEGLTTFEEGDYDDRSDCHAWGASPLYHFMSIVGGISSLDQGFKKIEIKPAFGKLNVIDVLLPHPAGEIKINLKKNGMSGINGIVSLPDGITGIFKWKDEVLLLSGGENKIEFN